MVQTTYKTEKLNKKRVYYTGTATLYEGYALCYNRDSNTGTTITGVDWARAYEVEKPATANLNYFAGLVAGESDSKTGPCWVNIIVPGSPPGVLCKAWTYVSSTILTTRLAVTNDQWYLTTASSSTVTVARAMQTLNTASTAALTLCQLEGAPSGGIDVVALVTPTAPTLTGGTTGGGAALVGTTALIGDMQRVFDGTAKNTTDIAAIITALKNANLMSLT